ncbi:Dynamin-like protein [Thelohanellus kitauei]|uniref:dynamin GTPase n=1 Tax=Thelohanellus kitauei TaxID=669202 RepID=A0A0C2MGG2_THEKT|nr:Dynamin-like protein [Thelohanellus kitauei]
MSNPNAIILCVQDGSVDAERSLVTELVSSIDPNGSRTICVLTKLDIAERNNVKIERIQRLMSGKLFPMKALDYFAIIAGTGDPESSISEIAAYEQDFFKRSSLFRDGVIKPRQATSQNLILSVSECFWEMVRHSIERETDAFRSRLFALEAEWRSVYPNIRELDREELFDKAKSDILDDMIMFCNTHSQEWERSISQALFKSVMPFVFREIYLNNALTSSMVGFQTQVEILLEKWLENNLVNECTEIAKTVMFNKLKDCFYRSHPQYEKNNYQIIFQPIRESILLECKSNFNWTQNNLNNLKIIQTTALSDRSVHDRSDWDQACSLMENVILENDSEIKNSFANLSGPSKIEQWLYWSYATTEQQINRKIANELEKMIQFRENESPRLTSSEISSVLQNLQNTGVAAKPESVNHIWEHIFLKRFYKEAISGIHDCAKYFRLNDFSEHKLGCNDVVLFFKIHKLLKQTVTTLRQQITKNEARRLESFIKHILENYSEDDDKKRQLLSGRQVDLAVEIKKVAEIKSKLDKFTETLLNEIHIAVD